MNFPTDAEIAQMMMTGGGAGSLSQGGEANRPMNVKSERDIEVVETGLPDPIGVVAYKAPVKPAEPKPRLMVGGVPSSAYDRSYRGR